MPLPSPISRAAAAALLAAAVLASPSLLSAQSKTAAKAPLVLAMRAAPPGAIAGEVRAGETVTGQILATDSVMDDRTHVDVWTYQGRKGERLTLTLASAEFDAFLMLVRPVGGDMLATDDDGGQGTNARVVVDLLADGTYHLFANTLREGETGSYTLSVSSAPSPGTSFLASSSRGKSPDWAGIYPRGGDPAERYALLVGIAAYPDTSDNLEGPADDVRVMQRLLVERYGFRPENVLVLRDSLGSRDRVLNAALRHLGQAGPDGVAVFYYSGHGIQMDANFGTDAEPDGKDEALVVWGPGKTTTSILDDELAYLSERLGAGRALFVLDACHSGAGGRASEAVPEGSDERSLSGILAGPGPRRQRVLLAASSSGQESWVAATKWMGGGRESVYTHYLVQHLTNQARPTFGTVQSEVGRLTAQYARNRFRKVQTPEVSGAAASMAVEDFLRKR